MSYRCYGKKIIAAGLLALSKYRLATRVRLSILCVLTDWGGGGGEDCQCFLWLKLANWRQVFLAKAIWLASTSTRIRIQKPWLSIVSHWSILQHSQSLRSHTHENWGYGVVENLWVIFKRDWWNQAWNGAKNIYSQLWERQHFYSDRYVC